MKHFYLAVQIEENGKGFACDYRTAEKQHPTEQTAPNTSDSPL